jgi:hypothetical protein
MLNKFSDSESSFPGGSDDINSCSLGLFCAEQSSFKDTKMSWAELSSARTGRNHSDRFFSFNYDYSAQDRPKEMKLVSLKLPRSGDSGSVFYIIWQSVTKRHCKMSKQFIKSLCDEIDIR